MFSDNCNDPATYWDSRRNECVLCPRRPGYKVTPNCGRDDVGGIHMDSVEKCEPNTFNPGSLAFCKSCSSCLGSIVLKPCTEVSDTSCHERRTNGTTTAAPSSSAATPLTHETTVRETVIHNAAVKLGTERALWAVPAILFLFTVVVAAVCALKMKKQRGMCKNSFYRRRTSCKNNGFSSIPSCTANSEELEDILSDNILSAPLHTVLDDLDVLEELVILLDPDTQGLKCTKHLASYCSFPNTWITYIYSMKDSKSPLKALLEGVTSKQPDWTVGHLAKLLRLMDRNDAIAVLGKLSPLLNV